MCDDIPAWLPGLFEFDGDWHSYVEQIYQIFYRDFIASCPHFNGRRVSVRKEPRAQGKEAGFWHACSQGSNEDERTPDLRRCERIAWIRQLIENGETDRVRIWERKIPKERRLQIALADFSYVVVLAERKDYVLFITAFHVEHEQRRRKLEREWQQWQAQKD